MIFLFRHLHVPFRRCQGNVSFNFLKWALLSENGKIKEPLKYICLSVCKPNDELLSFTLLGLVYTWAQKRPAER